MNEIYDAELMCFKLCKQGEIGRFKASVGSCNVTDKSCLLEEATVTTADLTDDENSLSDDSSINSYEDTGTYTYFNDWGERIQATLEADKYMASAAHASPRKIYLSTNLARCGKLIRIGTDNIGCYVAALQEEGKYGFVNKLSHRV